MIKVNSLLTVWPFFIAHIIIAVPGDLQKLIVELKDKIGLLKMQLKPIVQK